MKFIADHMLGKLAKGLRMLGYDTIYYRGDDFHQLFHLARDEGRMILTRNSKLLPRRPEDRIFKVTEDHPHKQLRQLIREGHVIFDEEKFFCRCLLCNTPLDEIPREKAEGNVPDFVFHQQKEFFQCPQCKRIYWPGTHQKNMEKMLEELQISDHKRQVERSQACKE